MVERTLILLKPDGVEQGLERLVAFEISVLGLRIAKRRKMRLKPSTVTEHYAHHAGKPFFPGLLAYMTRGPVIAMVIEGDGALAKVRDWVGATDPTKAPPETLRARFGRKLPDGRIRNVIHASENPEDAEAEIVRFFRPRDFWLFRLFRCFSPKTAY